MEGDFTLFKKREAIGSVADILKDVPSEHIREVLSQAENRVLNNRCRAKKEDLEMLFRIQLGQLAQRSCPIRILNKLEKMQDEVVSRALGTTLRENKVPFLPVIPLNYLNLSKQMLMVRRMRGDTPYLGYIDRRIQEEYLHDEGGPSEKPYYIVYIEDGTLEKGNTISSLIIRNFRINDPSPQERVMLGICEGISLCIHTNVLSRHAVLLGKTNYMSEYHVEITVCGGRYPELTAHYMDAPSSKSVGIPTRRNEIIEVD